MSGLYAAETDSLYILCEVGINLWNITLQHVLLCILHINYYDYMGYAYIILCLFRNACIRFGKQANISSK